MKEDRGALGGLKSNRKDGKESSGIIVIITD